MTGKLTYREKRSRNSVEKFLNGKARRPYILREDIANGLKENETCPASPTCTCQETLGKFSDTFKNMLHNNLPAKQPKTVNRNLQNRWLLDNIFDSHGNYIFCFSCIKNILNVSGKRISRLREVKREQAKSPTIKMRKDRVLPEQIRDIVPPADEGNVLSWWMNLNDAGTVEIRMPPKLHGGKSNNSKEKLLPLFLAFVDNNSQPNGRRVGSHGPLYFLDSKFDRINEPSASDAHKPENWKRRSLTYEFNRSLDGDERISNGTAKKWLKSYRPKHAVSPRKTDYCEMCAECREQKRRHETIAARMQQEGNGSEAEIRENLSLAESYGLLLEAHRMDTGFELDHYRRQTGNSRSLFRRMEKLQKIASKKDANELRELKSRVAFFLSLDWQQSKLTPHWGLSAQPSETYYLRKLSHNIFGIVDHTLARNTVYVSDERAGGAKNADITISLIDHYLNHCIPSWARHVCLFMDNGATNKNQFMIQWAMELVERNDYDSIRICFFVPGHGKSDADRLFSRISRTFNCNDVFVTDHLVSLIQDTIGETGTCIQADNRDLVDWKHLLATKYLPFKDIKSYRDFWIVRNDNGKIGVNYKESCYAGEYAFKDLKKRIVTKPMDLKEDLGNFTYRVKGLSPDLSPEKIRDLAKMYDRFIDPDLRPEWLPISYSKIQSHATNLSPSADLARQHRAEMRKGKRKKKSPK